ncbi:2'-5' RNA ligase family protein [Streptomyces goshikiensis]|uniref:2'-5' RNA ligase family protein n=1 Tax=Streptomyces goshikiensis TaxID=1942 RepID=UPI002AE07DAB|nr:2'-5' RNA ligase family protein [Streptomyces goshikiensis]
MTDDGASGAFLDGQTGLIVTIPEAEPVVRAWRDRLDPGARAGVPAHVTVLFPFLEERDIDASVHAAIAEVLAGHEAFDLRFEGCGRFPGTLYLAPVPDTPLRRLTLAIAERCPAKPAVRRPVRRGRPAPHDRPGPGTPSPFGGRDRPPAPPPLLGPRLVRRADGLRRHGLAAPHHFPAPPGHHHHRLTAPTRPGPCSSLVLPGPGPSCHPRRS